MPVHVVLADIQNGRGARVKVICSSQLKTGKLEDPDRWPLIVVQAGHQRVEHGGADVAGCDRLHTCPPQQMVCQCRYGSFAVGSRYSQHLGCPTLNGNSGGDGVYGPTCWRLEILIDITSHESTSSHQLQHQRLPPFQSRLRARHQAPRWLAQGPVRVRASPQ